MSREDGQAAVTHLLARAQRGDRSATDELFPLVYGELKELADRFLSGERAGHTLQATALVHEAYMRLVGPNQTPWESRAHFFGAAAQAVRRILIDHARAKGSLKRGGGGERVALSDVAELAREDDTRGAADLLALDEALRRLETLDPHKARVVELRFFGGLTADQTAAAMGVSPSTVARDWQFARAWLHRELGGDARA